MDELASLYQVFIFDFDGTLWNGDSRIPGVAQAVYELLVSKKTVLYYTNGGYSRVWYIYNKLLQWFDQELSPEQALIGKNLIQIEHVYNTA